VKKQDFVWFFLPSGLARGGVGVGSGSQSRIRKPFVDRVLTSSFCFILGSLLGHRNWVTAIATTSENPDMILTSSRGM